MKQLIQRCGVFLMILLLISGVLSSCGTEEGNKVEFTEPAPPSSSGTDEITSIAPAPGHIVIGQLNPNMSINQALSEDMLGEYAVQTGSTVSIKEYNSEKEMIQAARDGKVDIIYGSNLIAFLLAYEGNLVDLEPYILENIQNGLYYNNILEAGRVNDELVILIPFFGISNALIVPKGAIDIEGNPPSNLSELTELYRNLEVGYRSIPSRSRPDMAIITVAFDLQNSKFDIMPYWNEWVNLLNMQENDEVKEEFGSDILKYPTLFRQASSGSLFADPTMLYSYYKKDNGDVYTKYGEKAILIPYPYKEELGFSIAGESYCVPQTAPNKEAALHFVQWIMAEGWQSESRHYHFSCPIMKSEAQKWFLKFRSHPENMYTVEEQQAIAEAYITQADHIPVYSRTLYETVYELLNATGGKDVRDEYVNMLTTTEISQNLGGEEYAENNAARTENWKILFEFFEQFENEEETPKFYQDGALDIWPELVNDYVRAYITDLGYEMH